MAAGVFFWADNDRGEINVGKLNHHRNERRMQRGEMLGRIIHGQFVKVLSETSQRNDRGNSLKI